MPHRAAALGRIWAGVALHVLVGCAGQPPPAAQDPSGQPSEQTAEQPGGIEHGPHAPKSGRPHHHPKAAAPKAEDVAEDAVLKARVPFFGMLQASPGQFVPIADLAVVLSQQRVVCVGEAHTEASHHFVQWQVLRAVGELARAEGAELAVGFEMFDRTQQVALTAFSAGELDTARFLEQSGYQQRWGFDFDLYRPLLEQGKALHAELLGLNAPKDWTQQVARAGLDGVGEQLSAQFPELVLDDQDHKAFFEAAMAGHPGHGRHSASPHGAGLDNYYQAQVLWDETMAESASGWLDKHPQGRLVVFAGVGHCHRSAIPKRITRRTGKSVLSARPLTAAALHAADSRSPRDDQFDLLLVMQPPHD